ncbi:MAG: zinc ribbon domain-containing protein [Fuerstiella sp.]|nr:zinc ribbon domain-containing protein [Fuerstiella sp.]
MSEFSHTGSFDCPHCGEELPAGTNRCRHCGASDECGWQEFGGELAVGGYAEDDVFDDDGFDYDAFVDREFGNGEGSATERTKEFWVRLVILTVVISLLLPFAVQLFSFF